MTFPPQLAQLAEVLARGVTFASSLQVYWPPHASHHQLRLCVPAAVDVVLEWESVAAYDSVTPPCT